MTSAILLACWLAAKVAIFSLHHGDQLSNRNVGEHSREWWYNLKVWISLYLHPWLISVCLSDASINLMLSIPTFYKTYVKLPPITPLDPHITNNLKLFPFFKGALGALDGTHISACPSSDQSCYTTAKGGVSQMSGRTTLNALCKSRGWEGSPSDGGVFHDAHVHDLEIPDGKYYLADTGYPICDALLVPFCGVQYHLREWETSGLRYVLIMTSSHIIILSSWTGEDTRHSIIWGCYICNTCARLWIFLPPLWLPRFLDTKFCTWTEPLSTPDPEYYLQ